MAGISITLPPTLWVSIVASCNIFRIATSGLLSVTKLIAVTVERGIAASMLVGQVPWVYRDDIVALLCSTRNALPLHIG
ncbi:MAG: hypothetical protein GY832_38475 [Chloroflexi bacterium]|nr:hypothetical protein [Chloroflexota bacterium]